MKKEKSFYCKHVENNPDRIEWLKFKNLQECVASVKSKSPIPTVVGSYSEIYVDMRLTGYKPWRKKNICWFDK